VFALASKHAKAVIVKVWRQIRLPQLDRRCLTLLPHVRHIIELSDIHDPPSHQRISVEMLSLVWTRVEAVAGRPLAAALVMISASSRQRNMPWNSDHGALTKP